MKVKATGKDGFCGLYFVYIPIMNIQMEIECADGLSQKAQDLSCAMRKRASVCGTLTTTVGKKIPVYLAAAWTAMRLSAHPLPPWHRPVLKYRVSGSIGRWLRSRPSARLLWLCKRKWPGRTMENRIRAWSNLLSWLDLLRIEHTVDIGATGFDM